MDPRVLLMPVYTRGNEIERLRGALSLARFFDAHLDVIHAQHRPSNLLHQELSSLSIAAREQVIAILDGGSVQEKQELHQDFSDLCEKYGVTISDDPQSTGPTAS